MEFNYYKKLVVFICDLLAITIPDVVLYYKRDTVDLNCRHIEFDMSKAKNVKGKYFPDDDLLFINIDLHNNNEEWLAIIHELRHCYQFYEIESDQPIENKKLIKEWLDNIENYKDSSNKNYENQPIEVDANAFTYVISMYLYERPVYINNANKKLYKRRIKEILQDITYNEILEVANEIDFPIKKNIN